MCFTLNDQETPAVYELLTFSSSELVFFFLSWCRTDKDQYILVSLGVLRTSLMWFGRHNVKETHGGTSVGNSINQITEGDGRELT
ncbi:hypothetical protein INR49_000618 [Caranx melampygus]|nr:hypothetical protein INR49_000618 [Caranx melampygus]